MTHPRSAFGASPSMGASPDARPSLRTVSRLRAASGLQAGGPGQWTGEAGSTAVAWRDRGVRRSLSDVGVEQRT